MTAAARLLAVLALLLGATFVVGPAPAQAGSRTDSLVLTVEDVSPDVPVPSATPTPMTFSVRLTNPTDQTFRRVRVVAERDAPVNSQLGLNAAFKTTTQPDNGLSLPTADGKDVELATLAPHGTAVVRYRITTGTDPNSSPSLCLCQQVVYPIWFGAQAVSVAGTATLLGQTRTYVPSLTESPVTTRVAWVWPLIDRPHRLVTDTEFFDDDLASSVASGGRLDRALQVVEGVGATVPVTLVLDPELIDELAVMATGKYTVQNATGRPTAGRGQAVASAWLNRLSRVLESDSSVEITLTPYADPDQQALVDAGSTWARTLPSAMQKRVEAALGGRPLDRDVALPNGGVLSGAGLRALVADGASTIVLDQSTLVRSQRRTTVTLVKLRSASAIATAAVTLPVVQSAAANVFTRNAQGFRQLPRLVSSLAIRQIAAPDDPGFVAIAAPRYVDPVPERAIRLIRETSTAPLATAVSLRGGVEAGTPTAGRLVDPLPTRPHLAAGLLSSVLDVDEDLPILIDMLPTGTPPSPANLLAALAAARERLVSSAWAAGDGGTATGSSVGGGDDAGTARSRQLRAQITSVLGSVHIVQPKKGSYTLGSKDSRLPIAVKNDSDYTVSARVDVRTVDNLRGLSATPLVQQIPPHTQLSFPIKTSTVRTGTFRVEAQLATPHDLRFGRPIRLTIHSTALWKLGVVITSVAGAILALALVVRFALLFRRRQKRLAELRPPTVPQREPAA